MIKKILSSLIFQLLLAVVAGLVIGSFADASVMKIALAVKQVGGQVIFFLVPLIIFGFVSLSIARLNSNASKVLLFTFALA
ncbi:MAG: dicarboxylate/amino acid:cation symporter, partial [Bacteroides graminisolvens]|nr:dicarboxylate/amino acid:cation symporter [Bacteroides graminisolvens]